MKYYIDGELVEQEDFIRALNTGKYRLISYDEREERLKSGNPEREIEKLKQKLFATDYRAIKYAEGELSAEEYAETKEKRKEWRARINELEAQL